MDLNAVVEDLQAKTNAHAATLEDHGTRITRQELVTEQLARDMGESRTTLARIEGKIERNMRDAMNALPGWLGVILALLLLMLAAATFGHDLWPHSP